MHTSPNTVATCPFNKVSIFVRSGQADACSAHLELSSSMRQVWMVFGTLLALGRSWRWSMYVICCIFVLLVLTLLVSS